MPDLTQEQVERLKAMTIALIDDGKPDARISVPIRTITALLEERERLREALEDIAHPVAAIQRKADEQGARLNGLAFAVANDPEYLKGIARAALNGESADG